MNAPCFPPQPCPPYPPFPPFPANPAVGDRFGSWVWSGTQWVVSTVGGLVVVLQNFQVSGLYTPSPGLLYAQVEAVGGGGGGGGALGQIDQTAVQGTGWVLGGGGGSGGGYARSVFPASLLVGGVQVTIGKGGAGGQAAVQGVYGGEGGSTTFGAFVLAPGGYGGGTNVYNRAAGGGDAGLDGNFGQGANPALPPGFSGMLPPGVVEQPQAVGQFVGYGNAGQSGGSNFYDPLSSGAAGQSLVWGGTGGQTFFGGTWAAVRQNFVPSPGRPGMGNGVGGGGGSSAYFQEPSIGGDGGAGCCLVTEYCNLPVPSSGSGSGADCGQGGMARVAITGCGPGWEDGTWPPPGGWPPGWTGPRG